MTTPTPDSAPAKDQPHFVNRDLSCVKCGYNLRTRPWNANCPECGERVIRSGRPVGFHFNTPRSERLFQIGVATLAAALLLEAVAHIFCVLTMRLTFSVPPKLVLFGVRLWGWRDHLSGIIVFATILLLTQPFASQSARFRPRLAALASLLAAIGAAERLLVLFLVETRALNWNTLQTLTGVFHVAYCSLFVGLVLACVHLLLRVDRTHQRALRWSARLVVFASVVLLAIEGVYAASTVILTPGVTTSWQEALWRYALSWHDSGTPACHIVILCGLLLVSCRLRSAPRTAG